MKKLILYIIFILFAFNAYSQNFNLNANAGYGTFYLSDLKNFQKDITFSTPINEKTVIEFPGNFYYSFSTDFKIKKQHIFGLDFSYYTTGARNHIADYSGEYKLDMIVKGYDLSAHYKRLLTSISKLDLYFQFNIGVIFSSLNILEEFEIYNVTTTSSENNLKGTSFIVEPRIVLNYPVYKSILLNLNLGFEGGLNSKLYNTEDNTELEFNGNNVRMNWSGIRSSIGLSYSF